MYLFHSPLEIKKALRQLIFTACLLSRGNEVQMEANQTW